MELLNSSISRNPLISPALPKFPLKTTLRGKTASKIFISNSKKSALHPPFSIYLPLSSPSRFRISASFRRPTKRQNYLRKKLTEQQQVSHRAIESNSYHYNEKSSSLDANSGVVKDVGESTGVKETELESKSKVLGESVLWNKLEGWVEQYKKDIELWGIGTGPIFTVFKDSAGKVEKVVVNEDEIFQRNGLDPLSCKEDEGDFEVLSIVNSRISHAKTLAREMENGNEVLPGNSSVVKFVASSGKSGITSLIQGDTLKPGLASGITNFIQEVTLKPGLRSKLSRAGIMVVCGIFVISAVKRMFTVGDHGQEYTSLEKEMLRRKIKARIDKEKNMKGSIEVIDSTEPRTVSIERPQLDKHELMNNITKARESNGALALPEYSSNQDAFSVDFERKIQEIRAMARHAQELQNGDSLVENSDDKNDQTLNQLSSGREMIQKLVFVDEDSPIELPNGYGEQTEDPSGTTNLTPSAGDSKDESGFHIDVTSTQNGWTETSKITGVRVQDDAECPTEDMAYKNSALLSFDAVEGTDQSNTTNNYLCKPSESAVTRKFRIIQSVEEAREYLLKKHDKGEATVEHEARIIKQVDAVLTKTSDEEAVAGTSLRLDSTDKMFDPFTSTGTQNLIHAFEKFSPNRAESFQSVNRNLETGNRGEEQNVDLGASRMSETESSLLPLPKEIETDSGISHKQNGDSKFSPLLIPFEASDPLLSSLISSGESTLGKKQCIPAKEVVEGINETEGGIGLEIPVTTSGHKRSSNVAELDLSGNQENWIEKNFQEFEPVVKKIGVGFRDNYMVAKEKTNQGMSSKIEMMQLMPEQDGNELEWMKDERLREIVFKVRDNELAGRDPFHLMNDEAKLAFFSGLEKKVEQENAKLLNLHEWLHSNIENLDYGADGISVYDPPEKIIPRWKGPPVDKIPEFLKSSMGQEKPIAEDIHSSDLMKHKDGECLEQSKEPLSSDGLPTASAVCNQSTGYQNKSPRTSRTVIEGSDGSIRAGKKSGKEFWQHTKRWSQGFLESYNAETDPEIKATMKDIGKDLDRWITEKEIKEAADLMDKLPERGQKIIKEKLDKVKREMAMFGPHAVVSKYREYADEKEPDYLWWLDLPYILCIELYTEEDGKQEVGFYSLEMAADLELDPKQYHVIAFEDAGDCKNLCYIIQAHMEMLGNGNAFVVARPPKDAFRDAKANGFGVTVIRKGELQLNVDQTLDEVEELIAEVGSKMYHDKIMKERSLDTSAVMKGIFGLKKPMKRRRSKRKLKKPTKS